VILLDSDVLLIDHRYKQDPKFALNRQALQRLQTEGIPRGVTQQVLLEVIGILSFNISPADVAHLPGILSVQYGLTVYPDIQQYPVYADCPVIALIAQLSQQMGLGDAVQAVQIARHASYAECLLTWNARHFRGKLVIPVLTPEEWLQQQPGTTP
jgi:hypothetical protein